MSRGKQAIKRIRLSDGKYKSKLVTRLINYIMQDGKKTIAEEIVYSMMGKLHEDPKEAKTMLEQAIKNIQPTVEVRSRRVIGSIYQVPYPCKHERGETLALRWLVSVCRNKSGKPMNERLYDEVSSAINKEGQAYRKREEMHKIADANKAYAHYARY